MGLRSPSRGSVRSKIQFVPSRTSDRPPPLTRRNARALRKGLPLPLPLSPTAAEPARRPHYKLTTLGLLSSVERCLQYPRYLFTREFRIGASSFLRCVSTHPSSRPLRHATTLHPLMGIDVLYLIIVIIILHLDLVVIEVHVIIAITMPHTNLNWKHEFG